ncbi:MAG: hypothetical protein HYY06_12005 [Deltaproteobacteria bacterium]|nr:hypothetical protein [Deltaproteobacteria bacterium]
MTFPPPEPDVPAGETARGTIDLRYEDVSQDGRVVLTALPQAAGVVWRRLAKSPFPARIRDAGIVPLLTRLHLAGGDGPVSVRQPVDVRGTYQLAHTRAADGAVDRIVLLIWVEATAPKGRTHGPQPPDEGTVVTVGRVFAEHVFTRPFAPPERRKVLGFSIPGMPEVPAARYEWRPSAQILALPDDARWRDADAQPDPAPLVFGLDHTDSNQHVNSLVYPRLFLDAALRRLADLGKPAARLARAVEVGYRKPCFAGDRARWLVRAFESQDSEGAVGTLVPEGAAGDAARPHCHARIVFGE